MAQSSFRSLAVWIRHLRVWAKNRWHLARSRDRDGVIALVGPRPEEVEEKVLITATTGHALGFWGYLSDLPPSEDGLLATVDSWSKTWVRFVDPADPSGQGQRVSMRWAALELAEPRQPVRTLGGEPGGAD